MFEGKFENNADVPDSLLEANQTVFIPENTANEVESQPDLQERNPDKKPFIEPLKTNRFFLIRVLYHILRSIWIVAMIVGGFIAWLIALLFI
ncbi:MAG: hypothetical protein PHQ74_09520 [Crocinitomicaceae bacterium]|nr:hypothetical protein [Crocinitomicaceae bacterium]